MSSCRPCGRRDRPTRCSEIGRRRCRRPAPRPAGLILRTPASMLSSRLADPVGADQPDHFPAGMSRLTSSRRRPSHSAGRRWRPWRPTGRSRVHLLVLRSVGRLPQVGGDIGLWPHVFRPVGLGGAETAHPGRPNSPVVEPAQPVLVDCSFTRKVRLCCPFRGVDRPRRELRHRRRRRRRPGSGTAGRRPGRSAPRAQGHRSPLPAGRRTP